MANQFKSFLNADDLLALATVGGYSNMVSLTEASNVFLLSALTVLRNRWIWQTRIEPISDLQFEQITDFIDNVSNELMNNLAIGSFFWSIALLPNPELLVLLGQTVAQSDYPDLFNIAPPSWIVGTTLVLPDLRETSFISGMNVGDIGVIRGSNTEQITIAEMPSHNHSQIPHSHTYTQNIATPTGAGPIVAGASIVVPTPAVTSITTAQNQATGGDGSHNNVQRSLQLIPYLVAK